MFAVFPNSVSVVNIARVFTDVNAQTPLPPLGARVAGFEEVAAAVLSDLLVT